MPSRTDIELIEKKLKHKILSIMKSLDVRNTTPGAFYYLS